MGKWAEYRTKRKTARPAERRSGGSAAPAKVLYGLLSP